MHPHRRYNPLSGEWVLVSPQRTQRPWQGQVERLADVALPHHDASCYLCAANERAGGVRNPAYESTFVFTNDFPALVPQGDGRATTSARASATSWATEHVPRQVAREQERFADTPSRLEDYLAGERERVVEENEHFVACVPYWAVWPFETLVASRRRVASLPDLSDEERSAFAAILKQLVLGYELLAEPQRDLTAEEAAERLRAA